MSARMWLRRIGRRCGVKVLVLLLAMGLGLLPQVRFVAALPGHIRMFEGESHRFPLTLPPGVHARCSQEGAVELEGAELRPIRLGRVSIEFTILGLLPVRRVMLEIMPQVEVVPGGHSIGVLVRNRGVVVVGYGQVRTGSGDRQCPARSAGVLIGDVIVSVDGSPIDDESHLSWLVEDAGRAGRELVLELRRGGTVLTKQVMPVRCAESGKYLVGMYVRGGAAGVGTMTFFDGETMEYAALGHEVSDADTDTPLQVEEGRIVRATVAGIQHGKKGEPGEKIGTFVIEKDVLGTIERNTQFGIVGKLSVPLSNPYFDFPIPVASVGQVHEGAADILTVVNGQKIEKFRVEVQKVVRQTKPEGRGLIVHIVDEALLRRTGGIVQGMSGSPIVQDGRLVGAVTHVLVNDPARGYGVFAEWMVSEMRAHARETAQADTKHRRIARAVGSFCFWLSDGLRSFFWEIRRNVEGHVEYAYESTMNGEVVV